MHHLQPGVAVLVFQNCVKVGLDSVGITFLTVREQHARADVEGVDLTVLADIPALSKTALKAICGDVDKTLVQHFLRVHLAGI